MDKLEFHVNKTLKLTNVLRYRVSTAMETDQNIDVVVEQMKSYIRSKGTQQVGPLIQYVKVESTEEDQINMVITLMLQCESYIHNVSDPYMMDSLIRVPDAAYCRYRGPANWMQYAYQKIHLECFERDILLKDESYTIFLKEEPETETVMADVFIPQKEN